MMNKLRFAFILLGLLPIIANAQADQKMINRAHQGDAAAMVKLARCYENGAGVEQDSTLALKWLQKAAELDNGDAWLYLSVYHLHGTLLPKDTARYFSIRKEWADKGHPNALAALATAYERGTGCQPDTAKGLALLEEAVKKNASWGYYSMGINYMYADLGLTRDLKKSVAYLQKALKMGESDAAAILARHYASQSDFKQAWKYVNEGMKWGDPDAATLAAEMYYMGAGVPEDEARAQRILDSLVQRHHSLLYTQSQAGMYYMYPSDSTLRDSAKAMRLWQQGDAFGSDQCRLRLGKFYYEQEQYSQALSYFRKVALRDKPQSVQGEACYLMAVMTYHGTGCEASTDSAIYWLRRGVDKFRESDCAMFLAAIYMEDEGYKDMPMAVKYYRRASELGDETALVELGKLYANNGNADRAAECFQQMVDQNNPDGYYWLAMLADMNGNEKQFMQNLTLGEKKGSKLAAESLGTVYEYGYGNTAINNKKAATYYQKAGTPKALYRLGLLHLNGELGKSSDKEIAKGMELIQQAADQGYIDAIYALGYSYETGRYVDSVDYVKSLSYYRLLADNDVPAGQFKMGLYYELGDGGLEADSAKAIEYYQKAADQGHGEAMCYLGDFYRIGRYLPLDQQKAFQLYTQAHEGGEEMGTYYVGRSYLEGCGVEVDTLAAIPYLKAAAAQGVGNAAYKVADIYNYGRAGVEADGDSAIAYYVSGHENGSGEASFFLGRLLLQQDRVEDAFQYFFVGAKRGNIDAIIAFAVMLQQGVGVKEADPETAYQVFQNAVRNYGDSRAYYQVGIAALQGNGCVEDEVYGRACLDTAANMGHIQAMHTLGLCYLNGWGCEADTTKAISWLEKAADNEKVESINALGNTYEALGDFKNAVLYYEKAVAMGSLDGYCNLGYCYEQGQGVVLNSQKALELYRYAADHGSARGCKCVAVCYMNGIGVEESAAEALVWYTKSAELGNVLAMYYCGVLLENGADGVPVNKKQAKQWYARAAAAGYDPAAAALGRMR